MMNKGTRVTTSCQLAGAYELLMHLQATGLHLN